MAQQSVNGYLTHMRHSHRHRCLAIYGNTAIPRDKCPDCNTFALIVDGKFACCDRTAPNTKKKAMVFVQAERRRKPPTVAVRQRLLAEFNDSCAYCGQRLNAIIGFRGKIIQLRLNWDHAVPWSYSMNNHGHNFLPSCHVCNRWKYNRMFDTLEETRAWLLRRWESVPEYIPSQDDANAAASDSLTLPTGNPGDSVAPDAAS